MKRKLSQRSLLVKDYFDFFDVGDKSMIYNGFMGKGKQIGLRLNDEEVHRLDEILERINRTNYTNYSDILREFLGLRPRKVTNEIYQNYFSGALDALPEGNKPPANGAINLADKGKKIRGR